MTSLSKTELKNELAFWKPECVYAEINGIKLSTDDTIKELINRRRHQLLIHSVIYYELNDNVISDNQWSEWANELVWLQSEFPDIAEQVPLNDMYKDFDGSTGYDLAQQATENNIKIAKALVKRKNG